MSLQKHENLEPQTQQTLDAIVHEAVKQQNVFNQSKKLMENASDIVLKYTDAKKALKLTLQACLSTGFHFKELRACARDAVANSPKFVQDKIEEKIKRYERKMKLEIGTASETAKSDLLNSFKIALDQFVHTYTTKKQARDNGDLSNLKKLVKKHCKEVVSHQEYLKKHLETAGVDQPAILEVIFPKPKEKKK